PATPSAPQRGTVATAASSRSAAARRQISRSGSYGSGRLYASSVPSRREACRPAARATATGAAESHSYCPSACRYASTSPATTAAVLAPAEPIGTASAPSSAASAAVNRGARVRLTAILSGRPVAGGGYGGGSSVASTRSCAGRATAPATSPRSRSQR